MEVLKFTCPICKLEFSRNDNPKYFPFCSKRCQVVDLGAWASESYRVASKEPVITESEEDDSEY